MTMNRRVTLIVRSPEQVGAGIEAALQLAESNERPGVVFFCPGCASGLACRNQSTGFNHPLPPCCADRKKNCLPDGFRYVGPGRIARMLRRSDIVIPL